MTTKKLTFTIVILTAMVIYPSLWTDKLQKLVRFNFRNVVRGDRQNINIYHHLSPIVASMSRYEMPICKPLVFDDCNII